MVSSVAKDVIGGLGGAILSFCLVPQLWKMYCTRSAADLSMPFIVLYTLGLVLYLVYLLLEKALVGWITILVELLVAVILMLYKLWLDHWERHTEALDGPEEGHPGARDASAHSGRSYIDGRNWSFSSGEPDSSVRRGNRRGSQETATRTMLGSAFSIGGSREGSLKSRSADTTVRGGTLGFAYGLAADVRLVRASDGLGTSPQQLSTIASMSHLEQSAKVA